MSGLEGNCGAVLGLPLFWLRVQGSVDSELFNGMKYVKFRVWFRHVKSLFYYGNVSLFPHLNIYSV